MNAAFVALGAVVAALLYVIFAPRIHPDRPIEPLDRRDVIIATTICLVYIAAITAAYIWIPS